MLSGEGNENGEKTTIYRCRVISKKATLDAQHTFFNLCHCFVRLQRETSRNFLVTCFMEKMSYMFLFSFFSLLLIFTLVTASISHFLTIATKYSCCSSTKKCVLFFLSLALTLCRSFSRRALLACHPLSRFLCLSLALYSKSADMTINVSFNTLGNTNTEKIYAFQFCLYWLFSCLCLTRRGWLCDFPPK